jgi:hypothetical protein
MHLLGRRPSQPISPLGVRQHLLSIHRISIFKLGEDADFDFARIAILGYRTDDLDRNSSLRVNVDGLDDLAKGALAQEANNTI